MDVWELFVDYLDNYICWSVEDCVEEYEVLMWMLNEMYWCVDEVFNLEELWVVEKKWEMWKICDKDGEVVNLEEIIVVMKDFML